MKILGIESSCDETAAAVVEDGKRLLSNTVASSVDLHAVFGGVVPEIAARSHIEAITPVIDEALKTAKIDWKQIDAIAITQGPGLSGSLLIGVLTARTLAIINNKPLYAVNHVEAHVYANFITSAGPDLPASGQSPELRKSSLRDAALGAPVLGRSSSTTSSSASRSRLASHQSPTDVKEWKLGNQTYILPPVPPQFPLLALIVSGGHSQLVLFENHFKYKILGQTADDAIGEAFDKVAKVLGLPYPGGPSVSKAAENGNPNAIKLPKAKMDSPYDFSFSGLKTAVLRAAQELAGKDYTFPSTGLSGLLSEPQKADLAASFQSTAIKTVVDALKTAKEEYKPKSVVIAGGVAANQALRKQITEDLSTEVEYTDIKLCTDNAAMIAALGYFKALNNQQKADPYTLDISPGLAM